MHSLLLIVSGVELTDLLDQLASTNSLQDQADILHFLYLQKSVSLLLSSNNDKRSCYVCHSFFRGLKFDCKLNGEEGCTVEVLLEEVYVKVCSITMFGASH